MENIIMVINAISSKLALLALFVVLLKYFSKKLSKRGVEIFAKLDKRLMKVHKPASYLLVLMGTLHGIFSIDTIPEVTIWPWLIGLICLIGCIGAIASFLLRKKMSNPKMWLFLHRLFSVVAVVTLFAHVMLAKAFGGT